MSRRSRVWVLIWLRRHGGPASQNEIAAGTGYTRSAVSWALPALERMGRITFGGWRQGGTGRPAKLWKAVPVRQLLEDLERGGAS